MEFVESNTLEEMRALHEEKERIILAMADEEYYPKRNKREKINSSYRMKNLLDRYKEILKNLLDCYRDKEEMLKVDFRDITSSNNLSVFMKQIESIKDSSRQSGIGSEANMLHPISAEFIKFKESRKDLAKQVMCEFTDEECYGQYLDLSMIHLVYNNLPFIDAKVSYVKYLDIFDKLYEIKLTTKKSKLYEEYVEMLKNYLVHYAERIWPIFDIKSHLKKIGDDFKHQWNEKKFIGWTQDDIKSDILNKKSTVIDDKITLHFYENSEQLESLGNERLKAELQNLGLKSGGTLSEKAKRLFATKGKDLNSLDSSFFPNNSKKKTFEKNNLLPDDIRQQLKHVALNEAIIYSFVELLSKEREDTKNEVIRKQSLTAEERLMEQNNDDLLMIKDSENTNKPINGNNATNTIDPHNNEPLDDNDDDDDIAYNPKNLPLGVDGKPIPYWLYKLHGLNLKFSCEICGNHTYFGPKAFMRHFSEWRHSHGMRCLGIPNTAHFANVTLIEDAMAIWDKMCKERESAVWKADDEEFEDTNSNVITRRMYNDLYRQGFL